MIFTRLVLLRKLKQSMELARADSGRAVQESTSSFQSGDMRAVLPLDGAVLVTVGVSTIEFSTELAYSS